MTQEIINKIIQVMMALIGIYMVATFSNYWVAFGVCILIWVNNFDYARDKNEDLTND